MTENTNPAQSVENPYANKRPAYYALVVLTTVYSFNFIDRQLLAILQESIKGELSLSDGQLGLLTGFAFALFYVVAGIPLARWADHSNRRNIVALALTVWSGMTALSGLVQNYGQLLAARVGVGIGEAGGSPPSHSMISDIFSPQRRASALGFYSMGVNIGILFGFLLGGWLNEFFGWRVAFMVVGIPGVLLAIVVRFTLAEPIRGLNDNKQISDESVSFGQVLTVLWASKAFRHLALGCALTAFVGYSTSNWTASFMIRSHGMSTGELGTWLALIIGFGGAVGVFCGALLADRLATGDKRWYAWLPSLSGFIAIPFIVAVYLAENPYTALTCMIVPAVMSNVYLGISIATTHSLVGLRMRAMSSAILFFILNIIGLGMGPWTVGIVSDYLSATHGVESLRYAMLYILPVVGVWSACHFFMASRTLREDLAAAPD
jgi:predicted MFS family arabinose efflux permease